MQLWNMAWCFVYNKQADVYFIERIDWHLSWFFERECICALQNPPIYDHLKNYIVLSLYLDIICKGILSIWSKKEPFHIIFFTCNGSKWIAYINSNTVFSHGFMLLLSPEWGQGGLGTSADFSFSRSTFWNTENRKNV